MQILENKEFNGIEIYFNEKPQQNIITALKDHYFRWHNLKKCWYAKNTEKNINFIKSLTNNEISITPQQNLAIPQSTYKYTFGGIYNEKNEYIKAICYNIDAITLEINVALDTYRLLDNTPKGTYQTNGSDVYTDYFCKTDLYITPQSNEYLSALEGYKKMIEHDRKIAQKRKYYTPPTKEQEETKNNLIAQCEKMGKLFANKEENAQKMYDAYVKEKEEQKRQQEEEEQKNSIKWLIEKYQQHKNGEKKLLGNYEIFENETYIIAIEKTQHYIIDFTPNCMDKPITEFQTTTINKIDLTKEHKTFTTEEQAKEYIQKFIEI